METVELTALRQMLQTEGSAIIWAGSTPSGKFVVKVSESSTEVKTYACHPMSWEPDVKAVSTLGFVESDSTQRAVLSISPPDSTEFCQSRRAAVFGVNIGGDCKSGACKMYTKIDRCTLSYDIETSMENTRDGGFDFVDADILSIAARCSCDVEFYTYSTPEKASREIVSEFILFVVDHAPLWLIGWNCYSFDNECIRYWCDDRIKSVFSVSRIGAFGKPSYGSILNIPGTYNVDLLVYMNKSLYKMPSFRLGDVAEYMGVTRKTKMPVMHSTVDQRQLMEYNMNDCVVTMDIWKKERLEQIIPSLAVCTASPVYDCCRYVTGTLASQGYSSYLMSTGSTLRWGQCDVAKGYAGGYVMKPVKGVHENIVVCDFNSMYPTIMASCNINPHNFDIEYAEHDMPDGHVKVWKHVTKVWLAGRVVVFDNRRTSMMSTFMSFLVSERSRHKRSSPMYALSLKVLANSVYGSLGYSNSHIYSPSCAAAVTAIGRYCVKAAAGFLSVGGLCALYGDTDSVMVNCTQSEERAMGDVKVALEGLHSYMSDTSLHMMKMEIEEYYPKGIMLDKKRYCMLRVNGSVKNVGISLARRDVSGLCKAAAETSVDSLFRDSRQEAIDCISRFITTVSQMAAAQAFTLVDVSRYVKRDGRSGYEYYRPNGKTNFVPEAEASLNSQVQCDVEHLLRAVSEEIERFTVPCRLGKVSDVVRQASMDSW